MSVFDRLRRLGRAEIGAMKRALGSAEVAGEGVAELEARVARLDDYEADELSYARDVASAEAELIRDLEGPDELGRTIDEVEAGAALWGGAAGAGAVDPDMARGASLWGHAAAQPAPGPTVTGRGESRAEPGRTTSFPREVRDAYAALELPMGADREAVEAQFRVLLSRYHPDRHAGTPHLERTAHELTIRIGEARTLLLAFLAGRS